MIKLKEILPYCLVAKGNNIGLPIHFYTHSNIFENNYCGKKRYAMLFESESVTVKDYESD